MKHIALISDTHGYLGADVLEHLQACDEIWHGGDIGTWDVVETLEALDKPLRCVYGNIDGARFRAAFPRDLLFECEDVRVFMTHIGGYPGRYTKRVTATLSAEKPDLYICGHSHILKILPDRKFQLLHMNPGACGHHGFHKFRTLILFDCDAGKVANVRVVELGLRGRLTKPPMPNQDPL